MRYFAKPAGNGGFLYFSSHVANASPWTMFQICSKLEDVEMGKVIERRNPSGKIVYGIRWTTETGADCKRFDRDWTKTKAKAELSRIEEKLRQGVATQVQMTVADLFWEWHEHHVRVNCSPARIDDTVTQFRLRVEPMIGHRRIDTVNRRIVRQMVSHMRAVMHKKHPDNEYGGNATINKTLNVVKGMFSYAVDIDQLATNPAHGVPELQVEPQRQVTAWPLDVVSAIAAQALRLPERLPDFQRSQQAPWAAERDFTIIMLAALTGLRQSELLGLTWDKVDGQWLHVTHKLCRRSFTLRETKSRRGRRRVPLVSVARELLEQWRKIGAHPTIVFPGHSGEAFMRASHWDKKVWTKARRAAGNVTVGNLDFACDDLTFHELRHTFVSMCLAAGRDVWEVAHWAGDDPDMVKQVYGHYIPGSLGDTTRLDRALTVSWTTWTQPAPGGAARALDNPALPKRDETAARYRRSIPNQSEIGAD